MSLADRCNLGVVGRNNDAVDLAHLLRHFIDQTSSGFPLSGRTFFPGTDLLPPRAGITAMTRFPFSMDAARPASLFK